MYSLAVITVSDKGSRGEREDVSGKLISEYGKNMGFDPVFYSIVPDEFNEISDAIVTASEKKINLILTTGGTGFSVRDITPEATRAVIERETPGIAEALRINSALYTDRAMLSRGIAGIRGLSVIVNLPGSPKAVKECLEYLLPKIKHGIDILLGSASECARKDG